jgi:hypothetical protein
MQAPTRRLLYYWLHYRSRLNLFCNRQSARIAKKPDAR